MNQSNQQFWDVFVTERTVANTQFYLMQTKNRGYVLKMNIY